MVGDNVSFSAKLNVGEADSCLGGIEGDDVLGGDDVEEIVGDSENVGRAKLVVGTIVDVVFAVDSLRVKVCTRSPQFSPLPGDSNILCPRRYPA